ncbi:alpha-galactosidase A [Acrasis kona]|uniref:Alpha-galactosidase A n=1 Tax=Acrasis kona TaxID=1008807 RepID=A0AAW2YRN8_9EUKA
MSKSIFVIVSLLFALLAAAVAAKNLKIDEKKTHEAWIEHRDAWIAQDLDRLAKGCTNDTLLIVNENTWFGTNNGKRVFSQIFKIVNQGDFVVDQLTVKRDIIYITWTCTIKGQAYFGTDTFIVDDKYKIKAQTVGSPLYRAYPIRK